MSNLIELASLFAFNRYIEKINLFSSTKTLKNLTNNNFKEDTNQEIRSNNLKCISLNDFRNRNQNINNLNVSNTYSLKEEIIKNISNISINNSWQMIISQSPISRNNSTYLPNYQEENKKEVDYKYTSYCDENNFYLPIINFLALEKIYKQIEYLNSFVSNIIKLEPINEDTIDSHYEEGMLITKQYLLETDLSEFFKDEFINGLYDNNNLLGKLVKKSMIIHTILLICIHQIFLKLYKNKEDINDEHFFGIFEKIKSITINLSENYIYLCYVFLILVEFPFKLTDSNSESYKFIQALIKNSLIFPKRQTNNNKSLEKFLREFQMNIYFLFKKTKFLLNSLKKFKKINQEFISISFNYLLNYTSFSYEELKSLLFKRYVDNEQQNSNLNGKEIKSYNNSNEIDKNLLKNKKRNIYLKLENTLIYIDDYNEKEISMINVRPNLDEFILRLCNNYSIHIYSSYDLETINSIVSKFNIKSHISSFFNCNLLIEKDFDLSKTIFISDEDDEIFTPLNNTIFIKSYVGEVNDDILLILCDDLQYLSDIDIDDLRESVVITQKRIERIVSDRSKAKSMFFK